MEYKNIDIMPGVTLIRDRDTNIYVVEGKTAALVIDTGYGFLDLRKQVEEITSKPLTAVFTHGHIDHAFGGHYFDKVYMSEAELPVYQKHTELKAQIKEHHAPGDVGISREELDNWFEAKPKKIEYVNAGDIIDIGENKLEVISLKGHTPGSIGVLDRKHRILFSGDSLNNHLWMQLPESSTLEEYIEVLNSLEPLLGEFDYICNGHSQEPLPVSFISEIKLSLTELLEGAVGETYNHPVASGMIYNREGCQLVYLPEKIRKAK